ncbi:TlpA family protein disulfide reductase [Pseudoduganella sp.]|uniref:TlpA family protein disulfide reductase n=1 Tax=Pseudoduganella sp. TaxID=1880898 RepID=UPI0035B1E406
MMRLDASAWLNGAAPATDGKVVAVHAFQMLCPACVAHGIPQAARLQQAFPDLVVIGLHSVFEHHDVMTPRALEAFIHEYRLPFPVALDRALPGSPVPATMQRYQLRGTPSLLLFDRTGRLRLNHFGRIDDLVLGGVVGRLLAEQPSAAHEAPGAAPPAGGAGCDAEGCALPR